VGPETKHQHRQTETKKKDATKDDPLKWPSCVRPRLVFAETRTTRPNGESAHLQSSI
jgi:hypothetical protein